MNRLLLAVPVAASLCLGSCATTDPNQKIVAGTITGAAIGTGIGAIAGGPLAGAVIGAAVGTIAGAIWADKDRDNKADGYYYNGTYYEGAPPPPPPPAYQPAAAPANRAGERG